MVGPNLQYRQSLAELDDLHVLVRVVHHRHVLHPSQPDRYVGGKVTSEKLCRQRVEGADCDAHLHVHTTGSDEEAHTLCNYCIQQQEAQKGEKHEG